MIKIFFSSIGIVQGVRKMRIFIFKIMNDKKLRAREIEHAA